MPTASAPSSRKNFGEWLLGAVAGSMPAGVAALSGTAFGKFGEGYLRFSVANSLENLQQALDRLDQWTKKNL